MTRLEFFEKGYGLIAVKLGYIDVKFLWRYDLYKTYQSLIKAGWSVAEAKARTVLTHKEKYLNVARAIYWFERPGWKREEPDYKNLINFPNAENKPPQALAK